MTASQRLELERMAEDYINRDYSEMRYGHRGLTAGRGHWLHDESSPEHRIYELLTTAFEMGRESAREQK